MTTTIAVAIPAPNADAAELALNNWNASTNVVRLGEDNGRVGFAVKVIASPVALGMGMVAGKLDELIRPFGGIRGGTEEWLLAAQKL
jgi:hypothetical protein